MSGYDHNEPKCCCCPACCCPLRKGLTIYSAIFVALGVIGLYHYTPAPSASFGLTFMMGTVADEAEAFCKSEDACEAVCGAGDMKELASTRTAGQALAFLSHLLELSALIVCLGAPLLS